MALFCNLFMGRLSYVWTTLEMVARLRRRDQRSRDPDHISASVVYRSAVAVAKLTN